MAITVSTVGPGKDYSTLAAWWSAKSGGTDVAQAVCYSGSDLGMLAITSAPSFTTSASEPLKISVAQGNMHDGVTPNTGAYMTATGSFQAGLVISAGIHYIEVEGLACSAGSQTFGIVGAGLVASSWSKCLVVGPAAGTQALSGMGLFTSYNLAQNMACKVFNNIIVNCGEGIGAVCGSSVGSVTLRKWEIYHNTVKDSSGNGIAWTFTGNASTPTINLHINNNIVVGSGGNDYDEISAASSRAAHTVASEGHHNNIASDATASSAGPGASTSGAQDSKTASSLFTNSGTNDLTLKVGSAAIDTGNFVSGQLAFGFDTDILGRKRKAAFDCGAFEYLPQGDSTHVNKASQRLSDGSALMGD